MHSARTGVIFNSGALMRPWHWKEERWSIVLYDGGEVTTLQHYESTHGPWVGILWDAAWRMALWITQLQLKTSLPLHVPCLPMPTEPQGYILCRATRGPTRYLVAPLNAR